MSKANIGELHFELSLKVDANLLEGQYEDADGKEFTKWEVDYDGQDLEHQIRVQVERRVQNYLNVLQANIKAISGSLLVKFPIYFDARRRNK